MEEVAEAYRGLDDAAARQPFWSDSLGGTKWRGYDWRIFAGCSKAAAHLLALPPPPPARRLWRLPGGALVGVQPAQRRERFVLLDLDETHYITNGHTIAPRRLVGR